MDGASPVVLPFQLTPAQVRPVAYRVISKKHGLNLKSAALDVLSRFLGHHFGADWRSHQAEKSLDEISRRWKDEDRGIFVDGPALAQVIKDWLNAEAAESETSHGEKFDWRQYFKVVNATDQRRLVYDHQKRNFHVPTPSAAQIFGPPQSLTSVFSTRYYILLDKVYRNEHFQPSGYSTSTGVSHSNVISSIKNLLGRAPGSEFFLFGLLAQEQDGPWVLHDPTSSIHLEFTQYTAFAPEHYYTSGSFVLCHGHFLGDVFQVATLGPPLPEQRSVSQDAYGHIDFYSLNGNKRSTRIERVDPGLQQILIKEENARPESRIVFLGADIFLDKTPVLDVLRRTLMHLEENPPIALVLSGSFISLPFQPHLTAIDGSSAAQLYRSGMNALADIFAQCPQLAANTKVIMVPGPNDPWHSSSLGVLPYFPLPNVFTGRVDRAVSDIVWATNPTRLCYLSQEFVIFRSDIGAMLRKNSLDTEAITGSSSSGGDSGANLRAQQSNNIILTETSPASLDGDDERAAERAALQSMMQDNQLDIQHSTQPITGDAYEARSVMATLLDQCHLSPLTANKSAVIWEYDHTLSLAQWPTSLVLLDPTTPTIKQVYENCHVMNPGNFFYSSRSNWLEFWPASGDFKFGDMI